MAHESCSWQAETLNSRDHDMVAGYTKLMQWLCNSNGPAQKAFTGRQLETAWYRLTVSAPPSHLLKYALMQFRMIEGWQRQMRCL